MLTNYARYSPVVQAGNMLLPEQFAKVLNIVIWVLTISQEVQRGLSMVIEQSLQFNEWGLVAIIPLMVSFVGIFLDMAFSGNRLCRIGWPSTHNI